MDRLQRGAVGSYARSIELSAGAVRVSTSPRLARSRASPSPWLRESPAPSRFRLSVVCPSSSPTRRLASRSPSLTTTRTIFHRRECYRRRLPQPPILLPTVQTQLSREALTRHQLRVDLRVELRADHRAALQAANLGREDSPLRLISQ